MRIRQQACVVACVCALAISSLPGHTRVSARGTEGGSTITSPPPSGSGGQQPTLVGALQRGYRTGYSDGYQAGWRDSAASGARDYRTKPDYRQADRAYAAAHGAREDYRDGYRQGFESGYNAGYDRRPFNSTVPPTIARRDSSSNSGSRGAEAAGDVTPRGDTPGSTAVSGGDDNSSSGESVSAARGGRATTRDQGAIPTETVLRIELLNRLSSDVSQRGDRFEARVVEPSGYEGAMIGGRVAHVSRPGKTRGRAELQLAFDQIRLPTGRWQDFSAQVIEVVAAGDNETIGEVDPEGGVRGRDSTKDDVAKVGAAAGIGAIIGGIAGGGKGSIIGAVLGGGAATGGVLAQRGREIRLERGQQLMIRTSADPQIR